MSRTFDESKGRTGRYVAAVAWALLRLTCLVAILGSLLQLSAILLWKALVALLVVAGLLLLPTLLGLPAVSLWLLQTLWRLGVFAFSAFVHFALLLGRLRHTAQEDRDRWQAVFSYCERMMSEFRDLLRGPK